MNPTDRDLLTAYLAGSDAAFHTLVTRHIGLVYAKARRQAPPAHADDITQAVFLLLAQRAKTLRNPALLPAWLLNATRFCAAEARRSDTRRKKHEQKAAAMASTSLTDPPPTELDPHLDAALDTLSPADRTAIILRYVNDHSLPEVAAALSISEAAAKKRLSRALEKLRAYFHRHHLPSAAPLLTATLAHQSSAAPPALAAKIATLALTKSTTTTTASLLAKGATKLMAHTLAKVAAAVVASALVLTTAVAILPRGAHPVPTHRIALTLPAAPLVKSSPSLRILPNDPLPTITVTDLTTHQPLSNVTIEIHNDHNGVPYFDPPFTTALTAPDGTAHPTYPPTTDNEIHIIARKPGYVPADIYYQRNFPDDRAPAAFDFTLERAITIGGRVLDPQNNPLPNATVLVHLDNPYRNGSRALDHQSATTDAQGNWTLDTIPPTPRYISLGATHASSLDTDGLIQTLPLVFPTPALDLALFEQLKNRTHTLHLLPGKPLAVSVHGPDGKPLQATLSTGSLNTVLNGVPPLSTDAQGHIQLGIRDGTRFCIAAYAPGFASAVVALTKDQLSAPLDMTLAPPNPIHLHIIDAAGAPISSALFTVDYWLDDKSHFAARDFHVTRITDQHGDITWTEAPDKNISVLLSAPGCIGKRITLTPGSSSTATLFPQPLIRVHAIAAATGQPLTDFHLIEGATDRTGKNIQWSDDPDSPIFTRQLPDGSREFTDAYPQTALAARAAGDNHLPADSPILPLDGHNYDITLPLTEAPRLSAQILNAEGNAVPNLTLSLRTGWYDIYQLPLVFTPADAHRAPAHFATTDKDGNVSFPPQPDPCLLVGSTNNGYVLAIKKKDENDLTLTFHPWATIRGTVLHNKAPAPAGLSVSLDGFSKTDNEINMTFGPGCHLTTTTDAAGRFEFPKVFAGEFTCHVDASPTQATSPDKIIRSRPGQSATVTLTTP